MAIYGTAFSVTSACCATSSAGAISSDVLITPPTMIRKPCRFASSASASASVSPPALSSLILMASCIPQSRSRSARVRQDSSARSGIGRASALSAWAGFGCSISARLKSASNRHVFARLSLAPALVGIDNAAGAACRTARIRSANFYASTRRPKGNDGSPPKPKLGRSGICKRGPQRIGAAGTDIGANLRCPLSFTAELVAPRPQPPRAELQ
jgi:hypothetical protein